MKLRYRVKQITGILVQHCLVYLYLARAKTILHQHVVMAALLNKVSNAVVPRSNKPRSTS